MRAGINYVGKVRKACAHRDNNYRDSASCPRSVEVMLPSDASETSRGCPQEVQTLSKPRIKERHGVVSVRNM